MQVLQGFIAMVVGMLILIYRPQVKDFIGSIGFAEEYLGPGGTWTLLIILGFGFFIFGLMWATGVVQDFFQAHFAVFV
jgi:hypothetical protein